MDAIFDFARAGIRTYLEQECACPTAPWTLQGLGMLRVYLRKDKSVRLHVWDDRFAAPGASEMHTHPWDMRSTVIAGAVQNTRYLEVPTTAAAKLYHRQSIFCGEGGGLEGDPVGVGLVENAPELYLHGESYEQRSDEIHVSRPMRGTVTVVERTFGSDVDHAYVYWPYGTEWGSAEPRPATADEVFTILEEALRGDWG